MRAISPRRSAHIRGHSPCRTPGPSRYRTAQLTMAFPTAGGFARSARSPLRGRPGCTEQPRRRGARGAAVLEEIPAIRVLRSIRRASAVVAGNSSFLALEVPDDFDERRRTLQLAQDLTKSGLTPGQHRLAARICGSLRASPLQSTSSLLPKGVSRSHRRRTPARKLVSPALGLRTYPPRRGCRRSWRQRSLRRHFRSKSQCDRSRTRRRGMRRRCRDYWHSSSLVRRKCLSRCRCRG